jgi:hypothetical protein
MRTLVDSFHRFGSLIALGLLAAGRPPRPTDPNRHLQHAP